MGTKFPNNTELSFPAGQAVTFNVDAFDEFIASQGVKFVHFRALRCPVGMVDRYDSRRPHDDHSGCSNGFIYRLAGSFTALFMSNPNYRDPTDIGFLDGSTVNITASRYYDDVDGTNQPLQIVPFDRLYLAEESLTVEHWQLVESHVTGKDRLSFPVVEVLDLVDAKGKEYKVGEDFEIQNGQIVWIDSNGPGFNTDINKGVIYAIRYTLKPYFYVSRVMHQVRVGQTETPLERMVTRLPQQFQIVREQQFEAQDHDPLASDPASPRQVEAPAKGSFGPR